MNEEIQQPATQQALVKTEQKSVMRMGNRGLVVQDLDSLWRLGEIILRSGLAPTAFTTREAICVAIEMGAEVGLPPMSALQGIAVINGRPSLWGDHILGVCRSTGEMEIFEEWFEHQGKRLARNPSAYDDTTTAVCRVKRRGDSEAKEVGFSVFDAKRADLWETNAKVKRRNKNTGQEYETANDSPWYCYPFRMLQFRARSFALRDKFGDALRGMKMAEELQGGRVIEIESTVSPATEFVPPPADQITAGGIVNPTPAMPPENKEAAAAPRRGRPPKAKLVEEYIPQPEPPQAEKEPEDDVPFGDPAIGVPQSTPPPADVPTVQESLAMKITEAGYTWDMLVKWNDQTKWLKTDLHSLSGFEELPKVDANRLTNALVGLLDALKRTKEAM